MTDFPFPGLTVALVTPFDDAGRIDFARLDALIDSWLEAEADSILVSSGTGMHLYLSREESDALIAHACKRIAGRARVMTQASALRVEEVISRASHAADCGARGVLVLPPFFEGPTSDDGVFAFYEAATAGGLPVVGYNVPQAAGVGISPALFRRLAELPGFCAVKDSSGDLATQADLIATGLPVLNGADPLMPHALFAGARGVIWGGANFAQRQSVALVRAAQAGDWAHVRELWQPLAPAMGLIWQGDFVTSVYAAAEMVGLGAGVPRAPLAALPVAARARLKAVLGPIMAQAGIPDGDHPN